MPQRVRNTKHLWDEGRPTQTSGADPGPSGLCPSKILCHDWAKRNILTKTLLLRKLLLVVWNKKLPSKSYLICSLMKDSWIQLLFPVLSNMTMFERKAMFWHKSFACLSQIQYQSGGACKTNKSYRRQIRLHYRSGILSINANCQSASRPLCFVKTEPNCMCMYSFWYKALYMRCFR